MSKKINVPVEISGTAKGYKVAAKDAEAATKKMASRVKSTSKGMMNSFKKLGAAIAITFGVRRIIEFARATVAAYRVQREAEVKLQTIMKQRMGLGKEAVKDLQKQASEYQKIGVIGDEVQLAGLQQLATFVHQKESLQKMLPAMNNLLAQQKGYNVQATDAVNIANMMGRALTGQLGSLSRVGITFTKAQGEALKLGDETQRAAAMADILTANVGNVNEALGKTDLGKIQRWQNAWGDFKEMLGSKLMPILGKMSEWALDFAEKMSSITGDLSVLTKAQLQDRKEELKVQKQILEDRGYEKQAINDAYDGLKKFSKEARNNRVEIRKTIEELGEVETTISEINKLLAIPEHDKGVVGTSVEDLEAQDKALKKLKSELKAVEKIYFRIASFEKAVYPSKPVKFAGMARGGTTLAGAPDTLENIQKVVDGIDALTEQRDVIDELTNSFGQLGNAIGGVAGAWLSYMANLASTIPKAIVAIASLIAIKEAEAAVNTKVAATGAAASVAAIPIVGPMLAIAAITSVLAALAAIPKMADGGIVSGPTLAQVGEYPGASSNPEVIAPLSKLRDMIGGGGRMEIFGKLHGKDIYLSNERYGQVLNNNT